MIDRERRGDVEIIRLAAPPLHLLGSKLIAALTEAFTAIAADPPRAAVLYCGGAGADVREMVELDEVTARRFITSLHTACRAIRDLDAPVVAAIDGPCLGAHLEVAAACDVRVATPTARFGMPEIKVGIPSVIDAWWLAQICGLGHAAALVFDGTMIDAAEAHRIGLVNRVVDDLDVAATSWAEDFARNAPAALVQQKRVLRDWTDDAYRDAASRSIERFVAAIRSGQAAEAMRAMLAKREARF
ncbi:MAG: enoyl-CoA hydratase-related protein [Actinomycetota bacterium]